MATAKELLKLDLGITHSLRDTLFDQLLISSKKELARKGVTIDETQVDDIMLLSDYAAWTYRKRQEDVPLPQNIQWRIRNRLVKARGTNA